MIPVSKSLFLAKYPGANELRIPGGSKKENEKNKKNKNTRHAEHEKLARELVRERTWRPRNAFFCIMTLCGILFSLRATKFHSPLAWYFHIQTYVLLWQGFWKGVVKGNEPCNTPFYPLSRKISATEIAFHWNEVYINDWFTNLVLLNCQVSNSWKYWSPKFPDEKNCMPNGLPPAPLPSLHTYTFLRKLVNPHISWILLA